MSSSEIGVVTVSYGSETVLPRFLESLHNSTKSQLFVVVADNKPNVAAKVREITQKFEAEYLALPANKGYGSAINAAVQLVPRHVRWILLCNPDIEWKNGCVEELLRVGESDESIGAVGPLIRTNGTVYPSARAIPSLKLGVGHGLLVHIWPKNPWSKTYHNNSSSLPQERDAGWLSGACVLVRREAFEAIEGFDERYFMYFEDVDLGCRLTRAGWRNRYAPSAEVNHSGAHSTEKESTDMLREHHRSAYTFFATQYRGWYFFPLRLLVRCGLTLRFFLLSKRLTQQKKIPRR